MTKDGRRAVSAPNPINHDEGGNCPMTRQNNVLIIEMTVGSNDHEGCKSRMDGSQEKRDRDWHSSV